MTDPAAGHSTEEPEFRPRAGLRFRLWLGALSGTLVTAGGLYWLWSKWPDGALDRQTLGLQLGIVALAGTFVSFACAWWLDGGVVRRVRRIAESVAMNDPTPLQDSSAFRGWGELADLRSQVGVLITRHRHTVRAADQLAALEGQLADTREAIRRWVETERWTPIAEDHGPWLGLADALNRGFARLDEINEQNQEAARQIRDDASSSVADARETAEQAERGFVEATALLTTVRELERLGAEFQTALGTRTEPVAFSASEWLEPVSDAIRELVDSSADSVDELAGGLAHIQEITDQIHVLGNRATLIALQTVLAARQDEVGPTPDDLKTLAREARQATDRVQALAAEIEMQIRAATERMSEVRGRVSERLSRVGPPPSVVAETAMPANAQRAFDRMREMIQDAARKAERLSEAGERASSAAARMTRRLGEDLRDLEGLVVRLSPAVELGGAHASEPALNVIALEKPTDASTTETPDFGRTPDAGDEHP